MIMTIKKGSIHSLANIHRHLHHVRTVKQKNTHYHRLERIHRFARSSLKAVCPFWSKSLLVEFKVLIVYVGVVSSAGFSGLIKMFATLKTPLGFWKRLSGNVSHSIFFHKGRKSYFHQWVKSNTIVVKNTSEMRARSSNLISYDHY